MVKFHQILISISMMGIIIAGVMIFYSSGSSLYSQDTYNETQLQVFEESLSDMERAANNTRTGIRKITNPSNPFDVIGGFFTSGFGVLQTLTESFDTLYNIIVGGTENIPGISSEYSNLLISFLITIVTIMIFVGVMLHQLTKSERT